MPAGSAPSIAASATVARERVHLLGCVRFESPCTLHPSMSMVIMSGLWVQGGVFIVVFPLHAQTRHDEINPTWFARLNRRKSLIFDLIRQTSA
jgi:hypothetical protein